MRRGDKNIFYKVITAVPGIDNKQMIEMQIMHVDLHGFGHPLKFIVALSETDKE
jgi:hypothetical protein